MSVRSANLDTAGEQASFDHGQVSVVTLDGTAFARAVFNPGWKWSKDVKPQVGTPSCQVTHAGIVLSGRFCVRMDDGTETELGPGDAHVVGPGHDAWVVGDEQCVIVDVGPTPASNGATPEDVIGAYFDAFNRASVDDLLALCADDVSVMADGTPTASGRAQLRGTYEEFFAAFAVTEHFGIDHVEQGRELAVVRTHSAGTMTNKATGESQPLALRELFALRRTPAGWRISAYAFNRDVSNPEAGQ